MGHYRNHAIVVSSHFDDIAEAHAKAVQVFRDAFSVDALALPLNLVSEVVASVTNGISSFFIAPDGSKEGWGTSNRGDAARQEFISWMQNREHGYLDWVEVQYGDDSMVTKVVRDSDAKAREADLAA